MKLSNLLFTALLFSSTTYAGRFSGHIEGLFNTIGAEEFTDIETREQKAIDGNQYWADASLKYTHKAENLKVNLDSRFRFTDLGSLQFAVPTASITKNYKSFDISYGRSIIKWSALDKDWGIGKVNNRINFDFYDSGQEGLTGILIKSKNKQGFRWQVFGSMIYVPELNPGLDIDEEAGTITPDSAWATEISQSVNLDSGSIPIFYDVDVPPIPEIVFQYSVGAKIGYQNKRFKLDGFLLRKPENNLTLSAGIILDSSQGNTVVAGVEPKIFYHTVVGANFQYKISRGLLLKSSTLLSIPESNPEDPFSQSFFETTNIKTGKRDEHYWSTSLVKKGHNYRVALKYIARISSYDRTDDILAPNPRWNQAVGLVAQFKFAEKFRATVDARYDSLTSDRVVSADLSFKAGRNLILRGGVQFIGIDQNEISFWTPFANNDNVYIAARFVF